MEARYSIIRFMPKSSKHIQSFCWPLFRARAFLQGRHSSRSMRCKSWLKAFRSGMLAIMRKLLTQYVSHPTESNQISFLPTKPICLPSRRRRRRVLRYIFFMPLKSWCQIYSSFLSLRRDGICETFCFIKFAFRLKTNLERIWLSWQVSLFFFSCGISKEKGCAISWEELSIV